MTEQRQQTPDQFTSQPMAAESAHGDRSCWPTRLCRLSDDQDGGDVLALSPAQRIAMMWPLAVNAWAFMGEDVSGSQFQRHVVRIERRGG